MKTSRALRTSGGSDVVARRLLIERGTRRKVEVLVHVPRPVLSTKHEEWACLLEIRRGRQPPEQLYGLGVDSLQSLVAALDTAVRTLGTDRIPRHVEGEKTRVRKRASTRSS